MVCKMEVASVSATTTSKFLAYVRHGVINIVLIRVYSLYAEKKILLVWKSHTMHKIALLTFYKNSLHPHTISIIKSDIAKNLSLYVDPLMCIDLFIFDLKKQKEKIQSGNIPFRDAWKHAKKYRVFHFSTLLNDKQ